MKYALVRFSGLYIFDEKGKLEGTIDVKLNYEDLHKIRKGELPEVIKSEIPSDVIFIGQQFKGYHYTTDLDLISKALDQIPEENFLEAQPEIVKDTIKEISESVTRDLIVIQAIEMLDDLNKAINLLMERFREWYELYAPEVSQRIEDHEKFIKRVANAKREELFKQMGITLSMGGKFKEEDVKMLNAIANRIKELYSLRQELKKYIEYLMGEIAPNLKDVAGATIGARLISLAGGLKELALLPASTVQVLGAEKALFRHLRKGSPPPKHGVIFNHPLIQKLPRKYRGAMARTLASKILIAAKVDAFNPGKYVADRLNKELQERFEQLKRGIKGKKAKSINK